MPMSSVSEHLVHKRPLNHFGHFLWEGRGRELGVPERERSQNLYRFTVERGSVHLTRRSTNLTHTYAQTHTRAHLNLMTAAFYQDSSAQTGWRKIKWLMSRPHLFHFASIGALDIKTCLGRWFNFWPTQLMTIINRKDDFTEALWRFQTTSTHWYAVLSQTHMHPVRNSF